MRKKTTTNILLSPNTIVDVVSIKDDTWYLKSMTYEEAKAIRKKKGWVYRIYQQGL